jgi:hypothetical protein
VRGCVWEYVFLLFHACCTTLVQLFPLYMFQNLFLFYNRDLHAKERFVCGEGIIKFKHACARTLTHTHIHTHTRTYTHTHTNTHTRTYTHSHTHTHTRTHIHTNTHTHTHTHTHTSPVSLLFVNSLCLWSEWAFPVGGRISVNAFLRMDQCSLTYYMFKKLLPK